MRLLEVLSGGDFRLTEKFLDNAIPQYAILSHTWGSQEVIYEDVVKGSGRDKAGYEKIKFCSEQAARDGLQYFWVDSCAIDKSSSAELQESITSMFRWYQRAVKCYVYLSDVSTRKRKMDDNSRDSWKRAFRESRWFTRGWTLQELLAPTSVEFFSKEGSRLGDKQSLEQQIHEITSIPISALAGSALSSFSADQKMDWAKNRKTTREEDWAYSLMGIFEISMLVNYGEGRASAVRRLRKEIDDASKDKECLRHLYVTNPRADKIRIEETKGGLIQDSYRWILENCDFNQWRNSQQSNLLWIKGDPGKGKTMLLCGIIDELEKPTAKTYNLSYFFCQATDSRINSATTVLRGLLYLLIDQQPSLIPHIQKQHDYAGKALFEDINAWVVLSDIFTNILQDPNLESTYFIIDALDECVVNLSRLLDFIAQKSSISPHVKWLVSSRNYTSIEERLGMAKSQVRLSLELNSESISTAVSIYIRHKVCELAQEKRYDDKTRDAVLDHLFSNANDTFLWVALVCENLKNILRGRVRVRLNSFPPGLYSLYERMMKQICESEDSELCKRILASIATVYEPITVIGLTSVVEMLEEFSNDLESLKEIISLCGSFLVIRSDTIYFVHQSAKDYLLEKVSIDIFPSGQREIHYEIFSRSLKVLSRTLRRNIYGLSSVGCSIDLVKRPDPDPLMASRYSCFYWVNHLCDWNFDCYADQLVGLQDGGAVDMFVRKKFLYWLEALSLCGNMSKGLVAMTRLEALIKESKGGPSLIELVQDARRFMMHSKLAIEASPLQAYVSALLFSPACSLVRHCFQKEKPEWVRIMPAIKDGWGACLQTLQGHHDWVILVTFSQDSTRLASISRNQTIKVWDASSGDCLLTLECYKSIRSVAFSHTSAELMSVSDDGIIQVWDVSSGECLQMLKAHSGSSVDSVAFSHDLTRFGSASQDRSVQVWDVSSGKCLRTLKGYCDSGRSVTFSYDSTKLASTLQDGTVKVWDIHRSQCLLTLNGHSDHVVKSVFFSHDSTQLASASDRTIKVWDLSSGECLQTFTGLHGRILSVIFVHTLKQLAFTELYGMVRVWDISNGKCLQALKDPRAWISSVALSHNSNPTQIALASRGRVKIWNIDSGECLQTLGSYSDSVNSIAFSNNVTQLASAQENTVKVWNIDSGECLQTLKGHSSSVNSVAFSHESTWLASASDGTVKIWNVDSGRCLQTLTGYFGSVNSVAFSQDSTLLLSEASNPTVKVWDLSNSQCIQTFEGHNSSISLVAFSYDSTRLASASKGTVKVWNIDSGECVQAIERRETDDKAIAVTNDLTRLALARDRALQIWDIESGECFQTLKCPKARFDFIAFSHDSAQLASVLYDTIYIWNIRSGECLQILEGHNGLITSIAFSNDSTRLVSASRDCTIKVWDINHDKYPSTLAQTSKGHNERVRAVVYSYDSTQLASASNDRTIKLWCVSSGKCLQTLEGHNGMVNNITFSYNSMRLISGSVDGTIMLWDTQSGERLWSLKGHSDLVRSIALPYKSTRFASVSFDFTVKIWDLNSGTNIRTFEDHNSYIDAVALSHDLTRLALAWDDHTIRIWNSNNGECLQTLKGHNDIAVSVAFSYDSTRLASSSADNTVRIWDASSSECLQMLNIGKGLYNVSFDISGSYLYTDIGTFAVDAPLASNTIPEQIERENSRCLGVGLSPDGEWITCNSEKLIWLPSEYRPRHSPVSVSGRTIAIGLGSGKVWMYTLQVTSFEP
ncbi:hypothetical protein EPUS_05673 [Endocarpon pusillum Z07020]|uniref:NACHT domain-containing protein n=1 Tax=Endocarpon pusillum (strain Z07020 / HMAS-L-300199) TaxID=1263415 RepID=U1HTM9_ENDPU|nr:uncharacterized protein EPUS_05673 [Endocarpon pusillum Z07020]ERF72619.1 hypothetical protein EPUS_05673 [Endocarpon pusillum Z07020]